MNESRKDSLLDFCSRVGLSFSNLNLLELAFHHRSCVNEGGQNKKNTVAQNLIDPLGLEYPNNERLEFLGDSVLNLTTTDYLYHTMTHDCEGDMSKIKAQAVSEKTLAKVARVFGIDNLLVLGHGEELTGGRKKDALLADCMEAIIGSYYLDKGFDPASKYVLSFIKDEIDLIRTKGTENWKSKLQELFQVRGGVIPSYQVIGESGPDHNKIFLVNVTIKDPKTGELLTFGPCEGHSKKVAEQLVAQMAFEKYQKSSK